MDNENVVHVYYGIIFSFKERNEIMNFASKWVELGKIILNEVTQTENVKCCTLFFLVEALTYKFSGVSP